MSISPLIPGVDDTASSPAPPPSPFTTISPPTLQDPKPTGPHPHLLSYDDLPPWYQDNPYLRHGYRPVSHSFRASLRSWLYLHNESVNIYSHLVPAILFLLGEAYVLAYLAARYPDVTAADHGIFAFFLLTAAVCLGLSAAYHTLMNHSEEVEGTWLRTDLMGIVVLIVGDFVSGVYMVFWCERVKRGVYWGVILTLGAITIVILLSPKFRGPKWRTFRVLTFVTTGLSGFAPLAHGIQMFGFAQMMRQSGMPYYLAEGALLALGAVIYATRFPESLSPGTFDLYGSSHQLFHVLVVLATVVQLVGILSAFGYNHDHRMCSSA
ncbi:hemolysin-III channel protein Izh2 [Staphylotrichum tortipilum]|uniref:Hemolysin-III channel protein Izh2 n=1 Tax=Staphylotrichum tortipilum TaxID=2831512 RepID=A0AAN6MK48_9PEZI|nr:hemolysin-III channel protein Izh2 [Staphylotrichum longicolle]